MLEDAKNKVRALIESAFDGVRLGRGVSLHETIVIDDYGSTAQREQARKNDEKDDWKKLLLDPRFKQVHGIGGLSFYDAEGLRFHLPAYLCLMLDSPDEEVSDSLLFTLTSYDDYNKGRFAILNEAQRGAVRAFLLYLQQLNAIEFNFYNTKIAKALEEYWTE